MRHTLLSTHPPRPWLAPLLAFVLVAGAKAFGQTAPIPTMPSPTTQMPTAPAPGGWVFFDEAVAADLKLSAEDLRKLREVDDRYRREYIALGTDPMSSPQYRDLTDRRTTDVKAIMKARTYKAWQRKYNAPTGHIPTK